MAAITVYFIYRDYELYIKKTARVDKALDGRKVIGSEEHQ